MHPLNLVNPLHLHAVAAETRGEDGFQIRFGSCAGQIEIRFTEGIDQRTDDMRPTDGHAAGGADVGAQPIEENDLPVEQDDRDLGPVLGMGRTPSAFLRLLSVRGFQRNEDLLATLADSFARQSRCHCQIRPHAPETPTRMPFHYYVSKFQRAPKARPILKQPAERTQEASVRESIYCGARRAPAAP